MSELRCKTCGGRFKWGWSLQHVDDDGKYVYLDHKVSPAFTLNWHRKPSRFHASGFIPGCWVADTDQGEYMLRQRHDQRRGRQLKRKVWILYVNGKYVDGGWDRLVNIKLVAEKEFSDRAERQRKRAERFAAK